MKYAISYYYTFDDFRQGKTRWADILGPSDAASAVISDTLLQDYLIPKYGDAIVKISSSETPDYTTLTSRIRGWLNATYPYYNILISLYQSQQSQLLKKLESITTDTRAYTKSGGSTNTTNSGPQHMTSRENDTPQNGGDWSDDEHTSSISISDTAAYTNTYDLVYNDEKTSHSGTIKTETDPSTVIDRLNEIRQKYVNLYEQWAESFSKFVYYPATYENKNEYGRIYYDWENWED